VQLVGNVPTKLQPSTQTIVKGKGLRWILMAKGKKERFRDGVKFEHDGVVYTMHGWV
jgi:hypothetical protein